MLLLGIAQGVRRLLDMFGGNNAGHIQSVIFAAVLLIIGFRMKVIGLLPDIIVANQEILEAVQYRIQKTNCADVNFRGKATCILILF